MLKSLLTIGKGEHCRGAMSGKGTTTETRAHRAGEREASPNVIDFPNPEEKIYTLDFAASPRLLRLIDDLRGEMSRDEFLRECMRRGLNIILREQRPDLQPPGKQAR